MSRVSDLYAVVTVSASAVNQLRHLHRHQEIPLRDPARQLSAGVHPRLPNGPVAARALYPRRRCSGARTVPTDASRAPSRRWSRSSATARPAGPPGGDRRRPCRQPSPRQGPPRQRGSPATGPRRGCAPPARSTSSSTPAARPGSGSAPRRRHRRQRQLPRRPHPRTCRPSPSTAASSSAAASSAGYCSGTAINSPTRQLVLTAGHCVNSGREGGKTQRLVRLPRVRPRLQRRRRPLRRLRRPPRHGPGAAAVDQARQPRLRPRRLPHPAQLEGVNVADAVGGGATIVTDLSRHQSFQTFGYPGESKFMQSCSSPYIGDDLLSNSLPGPADPGRPLPLGARRQRRRLADRRRHRDQRHQHLPPPQQQVPHLQPLLLRRNRRQAGPRPLSAADAQASSRRR